MLPVNGNLIYLIVFLIVDYVYRRSSVIFALSLEQNQNWIIPHVYAIVFVLHIAVFHVTLEAQREEDTTSPEAAWMTGALRYFVPCARPFRSRDR